MNDQQTPTLPQLFNRLREGVFNDLRVACPARVERYDAATQVIDAQPLIKESYEQVNGDRAFSDLPIINNVPLIFPGGGGMRITFPVRVGDTVLLVFSDRTTSTWQSTGNRSNAPDERKHDLSSAFAIPGLHPNTSPSQGADTTVVTLGSDAGTDDFAATANRVLTELNNIVAAFNSHTHTSPPAPSNPVVTTPPIVSMPAASAPASTTVKIRG